MYMVPPCNTIPQSVETKIEQLGVPLYIYTYWYTFTYAYIDYYVLYIYIQYVYTRSHFCQQKLRTMAIRTCIEMH